MISMILNKNMLYLVLIVSALVAIGFAIVTWHYKPLGDKDSTISEQAKLIKKYEDLVNEAYSKLYTCENNNTATGLDGYINGIGENNEIPNTSLDNLST